MYSPELIGCNQSAPIAIATALNASNQVTGSFEIPGTNRGGVMLWQNGAAKDVTPLELPNNVVRGNAINASGQVAASVENPNPPVFPRQPDHNVYQSILIGPNFTQSVGPVTVTGVSYPAAVNSAGHVAGNGPDHAWLDKGNGVFAPLQDFGNGAVVSGINDSDQIVGSAALPCPPPGCSATYLPVLWQGNSFGTLGLLSGDTMGGATAINSTGQVVGSSGYNTGDGFVMHAFLWENGTLTDISNGLSYIIPTSINDLGTIVGEYQDSDQTYKAFVSEGSTYVDLGTRLTTPLQSGLYPTYAISINNSGTILVDASVAPGQSTEACYFLLKPNQ